MMPPPTAAPAVSVVIPARNAAATLDAALDSLHAQTMPDWEAIVVDNGSTDGTATVAHTHAARDPRVRLLRAEAGGASAARNAALAIARGRHLLFLDADDWIAPTHLERLLGLLAAAPAATAAYWSHMKRTGVARHGCGEAKGCATRSPHSLQRSSACRSWSGHSSRHQMSPILPPGE